MKERIQLDNEIKIFDNPARSKQLCLLRHLFGVARTNYLLYIVLYTARVNQWLHAQIPLRRCLHVDFFDCRTSHFCPQLCLWLR